MLVGVLTVKTSVNLKKVMMSSRDRHKWLTVTVRVILCVML